MSGLGYITFSSLDPAYVVTCLLGDGSPTVKGGYAGWTTVQRERKRSLTEWHGNDPLSIEIPLLMDNFALGTSIEHDIQNLEKIAGYGVGIDEPPLLTFDSGGVVPYDLHDSPKKLWVLEMLEMGDADRNTAGNRIRQAWTATVMEYIDDDTLNTKSSAERRKAAAKKRSKKKGAAQRGADVKRYVVVNGDTLESIAARKLGAKKRWHDIQKLNPKFRDPKKPLPAGTILKLP